MFLSDKDIESRERQNLFSICPELNSDSDSDSDAAEQIAVVDVVESDSPDSDDEPQDNLEVQHHHFHGRLPGDKNVPDFLRPILGVAATLGTAKTAAETFGYSAGTARLAAQGKLSRNKPSEDLQNKMDAMLGVVQTKAAERLMSSLNLLDDDKLENARAVDLSSIAANMSRIIEKTTPKQGPAGGTQVIIYAPSMNQENYYDVIES